jgi:predicted kinase
MVVLAAEVGHHNILAALLHDIGKPMCEDRVKDKKRVRFFGHEPMSAFMALDVMKKFEEDFGIKLFKKELFQTIAMHTEPFKIPDKLDDRLVNQDKSFQNMLKVLNEADSDGRFYYAGDGERHWEPVYKTREIGNKPKTATVLIGLPCSGKSSYIRTLDPLTSHSVISRDDIIMKFPGDTYDEKWKNADQKQVDKIFQEWKQKCVKSGDDLIFDLTHMSRKSRRKSLSGLSKDYYKKAVVFMPTLTELIRRNEERSKEGKSIKGEVYERMIKSFYPPMYDEFDEIEWRFE